MKYDSETEMVDDKHAGFETNLSLVASVESTGHTFCMNGSMDRWELGLLLFSALLVIGGVVGLLSVQGVGTNLAGSDFTSLEDYRRVELEAQEGVAVSAENAYDIAVAAFPEKDEPEVKYESNLWEAEFSDGTEVKIDAQTGEILEIEIEDDD